MDNLTWIILSEVSQRNTAIILYHLYIEYKKCYKLIYIQNRNRLTDTENKLVFIKGEREVRSDKFGVWD